MNTIKEFRLGTRTFSLGARQIYCNRRVFQLDVQPPPSPLRYFLAWLPRCVRRHFAEWFLPTSIVIKEIGTKEWADFENERRIFQQLRPLQGRCIPRFFGRAVCHDGAPALVFEYVQGIPLHELPLEQLLNPQASDEAVQNGEVDLIHPRLEEELQDLYSQLTKHGILHGDPELHNFLWTENGVVAVDFEFASKLRDDDMGITHDLELELNSIFDDIRKIIYRERPEWRKSVWERAYARSRNAVPES